MALQVPSFMEVFMIVERTARHNEFYEKFNCRYLIGLMLSEPSAACGAPSKIVYSCPRHCLARATCSNAHNATASCTWE